MTDIYTPLTEEERKRSNEFLAAARKNLEKKGLLRPVDKDPEMTKT